MVETTDVVVVGAGQAGLALSYLLGRAQIAHVVLERGRVGESWRAQRWDSFRLNTPNWSNGLPGEAFHPQASDGFADRDELVAFFEHHVRRHRLPVREGIPVTAVAPRAGGGMRWRPTVARSTPGRSCWPAVA